MLCTWWFLPACTRRAPVHYAIGFGIDRGRGHWRRRGQKYLHCRAHRAVGSDVGTVDWHKWHFAVPRPKGLPNVMTCSTAMWLRAGNLSGINAAQGMSYQGAILPLPDCDKRLHRFTQSLLHRNFVFPCCGPGPSPRRCGQGNEETLLMAGCRGRRRESQEEPSRFAVAGSAGSLRNSGAAILRNTSICQRAWWHHSKPATD